MIMGAFENNDYKEYENVDAFVDAIRKIYAERNMECPTCVEDFFLSEVGAKWYVVKGTTQGQTIAEKYEDLPICKNTMDAMKSESYYIGEYGHLTARARIYGFEDDSVLILDWDTNCEDQSWHACKDFGEIEEIGITKVRPMIFYDRTEYMLRKNDHCARKILCKDLIKYAEEDAEEKGLTIYEKTTARDLLADLMDLTPETAKRNDNTEMFFNLADMCGWDTPIYRADYLLDEGQYTTKRIFKNDAYIAAIEKNGDRIMTLWD